jgi:hypothetical protein
MPSRNALISMDSRSHGMPIALRCASCREQVVIKRGNDAHLSIPRPAALLTAAFALSMLGSATCSADVIYNNLTPNNSMAAASRPGSGGVFEIESADDFVLTTSTSITGASFIGLLVPGIGGIPSISEIVIEIYRVFPNDSNVGRTSGPPTFSTPEVPTRVNSPSDVATDSRDSATAGDLTFLTALLNPSFTTVNSVQPGGIHPSPLQTTGGNGPLTGQEIQFNVTCSCCRRITTFSSRRLLRRTEANSIGFPLRDRSPAQARCHFRPDLRTCRAGHAMRFSIRTGCA